jgi:hypothetical protein
MNPLPSQGQLAELTRRLLALTGYSQPAGTAAGSLSVPRPSHLDNAEAVITHIEVNDAHGVGVLIGLLFAGRRNILSIRSVDYFGGVQSFGDVALRIAHEGAARESVFARVLAALGPATIGRILCVPYFTDDVRTAIALREVTGAPLCTYLMDDQNIFASGIADDWLKELLDKSDLRLAISPEMRSAYQQKYRVPFWFMPPLADERMIPPALCSPPLDASPREGVMIGNVWSERWLALLRGVVHRSGVTVQWYGGAAATCREELLRDSIVPRERLPGDELVARLRRSWFAVVPTGPLDEPDDRQFLARLSLPSRMIYLMATSHLPILVLGSRQTAAARFVERAGLGIVCEYKREEFQWAVEKITHPEVNLRFRRRACELAPRFTSRGALEWIWESLARKSAADDRYERILPAPNG